MSFPLDGAGVALKLFPPILLLSNKIFNLFSVAHCRHLLSKRYFKLTITRHNKTVDRGIPFPEMPTLHQYISGPLNVISANTFVIYGFLNDNFLTIEQSSFFL